MADTKTFRQSMDEQHILRIREICKDLPQACGDFLRASSVTTASYTRLAYAKDFRTFFHFLHAERVAFSDREPRLFTDDDLARLTSNDITAYAEYLTYYFRDADGDASKALVNHEVAIKRKLCAVRSLYDYLFKEKRIPVNNSVLVSLPKIHEKPIIYLNKEEMARLLDAVASGEGLTDRQKQFHQLTARRDYAMLMLFLTTGIRVSECVGIDLEDIDLEENAFLVTRKGGNQMKLYFPPETAEALADYMEERAKVEAQPGHEKALFLSLQKRRITQRSVELLVKKYAAVAAPLKKKMSPHKLRATFATNLYEATGDIYLVADTLGHSSVDVTRKHYANMTDARRRMAASYAYLPDEVKQGELNVVQAEERSAKAAKAAETQEADAAEAVTAASPDPSDE